MSVLHRIDLNPSHIYKTVERKAASITAKFWFFWQQCLRLQGHKDTKISIFISWSNFKFGSPKNISLKGKMSDAIVQFYPLFFTMMGKKDEKKGYHFRNTNS